MIVFICQSDLCRRFVGWYSGMNGMGTVGLFSNNRTKERKVIATSKYCQRRKEYFIEKTMLAEKCPGMNEL